MTHVPGAEPTTRKQRASSRETTGPVMDIYFATVTGLGNTVASTVISLMGYLPQDRHSLCELGIVAALTDGSTESVDEPVAQLGSCCCCRCGRCCFLDPAAWLIAMPPSPKASPLRVSPSITVRLHVCVCRACQAVDYSDVSRHRTGRSIDTASGGLCPRLSRRECLCRRKRLSTLFLKPPHGLSVHCVRRGCGSITCHRVFRSELLEALALRF